MRPAEVAGVDQLSRRFRLIRLAGEALQGLDWAAGQKIQVAMGSGLSARTYTPIGWDSAAGSMRILAYLHGDGPGSAWALGLRPGDSCQFFGPRRSLDRSGLPGPFLVFGDETSLGLAAALRETPEGAGLDCVLEASDAAEARVALEAVGCGAATVIERRDDDAHLAQVETVLADRAGGAASSLLTGKASSIQRVGRALKSAGVAASRIKAKAYWAPGKTGLD